MRRDLTHAAGVVAPAADACGEDLCDDGEPLGRREYIALNSIFEVGRHGCIRAMARSAAGQ